MTKITDRIGDRVRRYREKGGLSLRDLADESGVSLSHLHKIENSKTNAGIETIYQISKALGIELEMLWVDENWKQSAETAGDLLEDVKSERNWLADRLEERTGVPADTWRGLAYERPEWAELLNRS